MNQFNDFVEEHPKTFPLDPVRSTRWIKVEHTWEEELARLGIKDTLFGKDEPYPNLEDYLKTKL